HLRKHKTNGRASRTLSGRANRRRKRNVSSRKPRTRTAAGSRAKVESGRAASPGSDGLAGTGNRHWGHRSGLSARLDSRDFDSVATRWKVGSQRDWVSQRKDLSDD